MAKRPTITDLARVSSFSVATVDRVLNSRLPVREETARRVYEAATEIGYHAAGLIKQRMRQELPEYRLGFLLLRGNDVFYGDFARELELEEDGWTAVSTLKGTGFAPVVGWLRDWTGVEFKRADGTAF